MSCRIQVCSDHGKWASLNTVTLLITPTFTPALVNEGQSGEDAGFKLALIIVIAPYY